MYLTEKWRVQPCTEGLDIHCYSWFKQSENSLIDYRKNAAEKQLVSVKCRGFQGWVLVLIPNLLFAISGHRKIKGNASPGEAASVAMWSIFCRHVQSWYRMCLQFTLFFSFGRTSAFPSFICLWNQAPACAEPGRGPWARESPSGWGLCSLATCLARGKTACRNWEHLSDSHILEAAPANRVAGEAQQRQRWIPPCVCVCVCMFGLEGTFTGPQILCILWEFI